MTVKSSDVLRLAAELALSGSAMPTTDARMHFALSGNQFGKVREYAFFVGYNEAINHEEDCMALCLAAAIAEEERD